MDQYVTGAMIRQLREKAGMTQAELAQKLFVSDKAVSKWETGKGHPDISLLEPIAAAFGVSVVELLSGNAVSNGNVSGNMLRSKFYACPVCGNAVHCMGEAVVACHGVQLIPLQAEKPDAQHEISIERSDAEYYVAISHEMSKNHHVDFIAALSADRVQMVRLYPEGNAEARFQISGVRRILYYCNKDGLFAADIRG